MDTMTKTEAARRLAHWAQRRGMTAHEIGKRMGVASSTVRGYLLGINEPSVSRLGELLAALAVEPAQFWAVPPPEGE